MLNFKKTLPVVFIAASAMLCSSPSFAYQSENSEVKVTIDKRDLETDAGVERVWNQLSRKAARSCESSGMFSAKARQSAETCTNSLLDSFITDVGHSTLTSYHIAHQDI